MYDEDDKVGYKKPPKATQFKKGQSGNPKGRPKTRGSQQIDIEAILNADETVKSPGGNRKFDSRELQIRNVVPKALDGDFSSLVYLIELFEKYDAISIPVREQDHGVVVLPTNTYPSKVCSIAFHMYGRPPWSDRQLKPIIEEYLATRSDEERIEDERMGYEL
ncbi:MAG: DUF5681 domain-containing protein [Pseudomonadota bacterium]